MTAEIISGKELAQEIRTELKDEVKTLNEKNITPHLTVILVGDNPASQCYVKGKKKATAVVDISSELIELLIETKEETLINKIVELNNNDHVQSILLQHPFPSQIDVQIVIETIGPIKDVDGFRPIN